MTVDFMMQEAAEKQGWNVDTQLYLALEYIDNQKDASGFKEFLQYLIEEEEDATDS